MAIKKILKEIPGETIYENHPSGQIYQRLTDTYYDVEEKKAYDVPGRGAIVQKISSFLFSKLNKMGVPTHFVRTLNMRECLVQSSVPLPFEIKIHLRSNPQWSATFGIGEEKIFEPFLMEYFSTPNPYSLSEDTLMAFEWVDEDDMDAISELCMRVALLLQGFFMSFDLDLVHFKISLCQSSEGLFMVGGHFSPENFYLKNEEGIYMGAEALLDAEGVATSQAYYTIARHLGLFFHS